MSEAELLAVYDKAKDPRSSGRRFMDKVAYGMLETEKVIKMATRIVSYILALYLAVIGGYIMGYEKWQEAKAQIARDRQPPAMVKRVHSD